MTAHPSFLALDRLALGQDPGEATCEHLRACGTCRAHIARVQTTIDVPAWVGHLGARRRPARARRWMSGFALAAAAAAVLVLLVRRDPAQPRRTAVGKGGAPSVALHIKRGERVLRWDGEVAVMPGDRLRLEVAGDGMAHVAVFEAVWRAGALEYRALYRGPLEPGHAELLPPAWEVDDDPGDELLVVAVGPAEVSAASLRRDRPESADPDIWVIALALPNKMTEDFDR